MSESKTAYWLMMVMVFGVANIKLYSAVQAYEGIRELYYAVHDPDCELLSDKERQRLSRTTLRQAEGVMAHCQKNGIGIMTWDDAMYPDALRQIYNPPMVLFYRGDVSLLHKEVILGVVGARKASDYSLRVTRCLCGDIARHNVVIASGCAVGIDGTAHRAALDAGTPTIGVLGCGVDYDYPKPNRELKEQIVHNGLLLSEYFPGTQPYPANFPVRNRILAGISEGLLVVEASDRSGSLITANLACEQGKSIFCVPPPDIFDKRYRGVVRFLRDGAYPAFDVTDILYALYLKYPYKITFFDEEENSRTQDSLVFHDKGEKEKPKRPSKSSAYKQPDRVQETEKASAPAVYVMPEEATEEHKRILTALQKGGQNVNALCLLLDMEFTQVSVLLMEMEMLGWIVNTQRDIYALPE